MESCTCNDAQKRLPLHFKCKACNQEAAAALFLLPENQPVREQFMQLDSNPANTYEEAVAECESNPNYYRSMGSRTCYEIVSKGHWPVMRYIKRVSRPFAPPDDIHEEIGYVVERETFG